MAHKRACFYLQSTVFERWRRTSRAEWKLDLILDLAPRSHRDKFFRRRWMNGHNVVEVRLERAHFDRDAKALNHFVCTETGDVQTNDCFFSTDADQLHRSLLLVFGLVQRVEHVDKRRSVYRDVFATILFNRFGLSVSNRANGRMAEYDCGDLVVVEAGVGLHEGA